MLFKSVFALAVLASSAAAAPAADSSTDSSIEERAASVFRCQSNLKGQPRGKPKAVNQNISEAQALAAVTAGGTTTGATGFPHSFGNGGAIKFLGANPLCNEKNPQLLEFPVSDKQTFTKDGVRDTTTPARVIYTADGKSLCGVITHIIVDDKGHGSGDFRICDP